MKYANALPSHSQSSKVVKNGHRHGKHSYLCRNCQSQFRGNPQPPGYSTQVKDLCVKMSLNGMGWSGFERVTGIWHNSVINWVRQAEAKIALEKLVVYGTIWLDFTARLCVIPSPLTCCTSQYACSSTILSTGRFLCPLNHSPLCNTSLFVFCGFFPNPGGSLDGGDDEFSDIRLIFF